MPTPTATFNDQSIPFGSRTEKVYSQGANNTYTAVRLTAIFEDITISWPSKTIPRPNQISGPNGFVLIAEQPTGTATIQLGLTSTDIPHLGDAIKDTFLGSTTETWVISNVGAPINMGSYRKCNVSLIMAHLSGDGTGADPFSYVPTGNPGWTND